MKEPDAPARDAATTVLAWGAAVVVLAHLPGVFTRGDVLRGAVAPFYAALAAALAVAGAGGRRMPRAFLLLLLLPLAVLVPGAISARGAGLAALLRDGAPWITMAALGPGAARVLRGEADVRRLLGALAVAAAAAAVWTVWSAVNLHGPGVGPFGRPGVAGPVLAALLPVAVLAAPGRRRAVRIALPALVAAGVVATLSRTALVAAGVVLPLALAFGPVGRRTLPRRALVGASAGAVLLAALTVGGHLPLPGGGTTFAVRLGLWRASAALVAERPLGGHGLGSFPSEVLRRRDLEEARLSRGRRPMVAHDDVLHAAVEGGVPAGAALALYLLGALALAAAARRRAPAGGTAPAAAAAGLLGTLAVASLAEDVLLDPAGATLLALGAAAAATLATRTPAAGARRVLLLVPLVLLALATAGVRSKDAFADAALRRVVDAGPGEGEVARLRGVLRWRGDHPEAWRLLGAARARRGDLEGAREAYRTALQADPGLTIAWLAIAESWRRQGRPDDARDALAEAARRDPTSFDVPMQLGHLAMGPEPVPGDPGDHVDDLIGAMRHYNEAEALAPDRFEVPVARARIARRRGDPDEAGARLRDAQARSPGEAETLLESFRLAEVQRGVPDLAAAGILALALAANPRLAPDVEREAEDLLDEGARREDEARAALHGPEDALDLVAADRAYDAAAIRIAGLLHAGLLPPPAALAHAMAENEAKAWRRAYARWRALLSAATLEAPARTDALRAEQLDRLAAIQLETAKVATRVDAPAARRLYAEGHASHGASLLAARRFAEARTVLEDAAGEAPGRAEVRLLLARACLGAGDLDAAEAALLEALRLEPQRAREVAEDAGLAPVLVRPAVREALSGR